MRKQENTYDMMKKLLATSRKGIIRQIVKEDQGDYYAQKQKSREITPDELEQEKSAFAQDVTKLVEFGDFKISNDTVTWSGVFPKEKIEWTYSLDSDQGVYISCELTQLTDNTLKLIQLLRGYYETWAEKWSGEIGVQGAEPTPEEGNQQTNEPAPGQASPTAQGPIA